MWILTELQQQLQQQLASFEPSSKHAIIALQAENHASDWQPLSWLKAQGSFPHFFWQSRDESLSIATLGAIHQFDNLESAETFSQQHAVPVVGGLTFEGQCQFILPRLSLVKQGDKLTACLYLDLADIENEKVESESLLEQLATFFPHQAITQRIMSSQSANDFNAWQALLSQALNAIEHAHFRKVVLANATTFSLDSAINPYDLLYASQQKNRGCYHFLWSENGSETFLGSSPERLYQRTGKQLQTEALAGTVAVSADPNETERNALWLLSDEKNVYENQLVVDDICQHLQDCSEHIQVSQAEIKRLPNVQHLRRAIQATLKTGVQDSDCLARIQPTAAVAGLPRHNALPFIAKHEGFDRGWYAGTLGYMQPEQAEFCVTLRSAKLCADQLTLYAGAGIVAGSTAEMEWQEIQRKLQGLQSLLNSQ